MDFAIIVSSILRAHGFDAGAETLTVCRARTITIDFHPPGLLLYVELDPERSFAYNANVNVNPRCRHRGIGARLLAALEEICRQADLTILINDNKNPAFWKRHGYRRLNPFWQMRLAKRLDLDLKVHSVFKKT